MNITLEGKIYKLNEIRKCHDTTFQPTLGFSTTLPDGTEYEFNSLYLLEYMDEPINKTPNEGHDELLIELFEKIHGVDVNQIREGTENRFLKEYVQEFGPSDLEAEVQEKNMELIESIMKHV